MKNMHHAAWAVGIALLFAGCSSRAPLVLYRPGDVPAWRNTQPVTPPPAAARPEVLLVTNKGSIVIELFADAAPESVANFLGYVDDGHFSGTIFHRVIIGFMVQGGGFTPDMVAKPTRPPITNEAGNGLRNARGTLAMARTNDVNSATSQFFINLVDNTFLNGDGVTGGYAVFGRVKTGMEVVDAISLVDTARSGTHDDVPVTPVIIERVTRL
jgi:cyclophilin family peptidyl-prolyl cis-trans isomerase